MNNGCCRKKCSCCGESKVLSNDYFYPSKYKPDGFADKCKVCEIKDYKKVSKPWVDHHLVGLAKKKKQQEAQRRKKVRGHLKARTQGLYQMFSN